MSLLVTLLVAVFVAAASEVCAAQTRYHWYMLILQGRHLSVTTGAANKPCGEHMRS